MDIGLIGAYLLTMYPPRKEFAPAPDFKRPTIEELILDLHDSLPKRGIVGFSTHLGQLFRGKLFISQ